MADWLDIYYGEPEYFEADDGTVRGVTWADPERETLHMAMDVEMVHPLTFLPHVTLGKPEPDDG